MRSRIVGAVALLFGLAIMVMLFQDSKPLAWKPFLGGVLFVGLGGYYLFTGRRAASMNEFIVEGKLYHDDAPGSKARQGDGS